MAIYRCFFHPVSKAGVPVPNASGDLPSVDVEARSAEEAARLARKRVAHPIAETQRIDDEERA